MLSAVPSPGTQRSNHEAGPKRGLSRPAWFAPPPSPQKARLGDRRTRTQIESTLHTRLGEFWRPSSTAVAQRFYGAQRAFYISWSEGRAQSGEREWETRRGVCPLPSLHQKGSAGGLYTQIGTKYFFSCTLQSTFLPTYLRNG